MDVLGETWTFLTSAASWTGSRGILARGWAHVWISLVSTAIAAVIALPSGSVMAHRRIAPIASVAVVNIGRAIPSFALIALLFPLSLRYGFGLGFWPTSVALVVLGIPPMFANAYAGVAETPDATIEAARSLGMTDIQVLRRVELPFAIPLLTAGVRISSVQIFATATLGAFVGYECLGSFIASGLARGRSGQPEVLAGAILVAVSALIVDSAIGRSEERLAPWRSASRQSEEPETDGPVPARPQALIAHSTESSTA